MNPLDRLVHALPALNAVFLGNTVRAYLLFALTAAVGVLAVWILDRTVIRAFKKLARRTDSSLDDFVVEAAEKFLIPALYVLAIWLGFKHLVLAPWLVKALRALVVVLVAVQGVRFLSGLARQLLQRQMLRRAGSPEAAELEMRSVRGILVILNVVVWIMATLLVLDNLGVEVSAFVAGLGIGGIAIALAAQAVLGDLFSYFVIFFDRPFQVGHSIRVGNFHGEVESIGIKTTRLRSQSGELVVMSNKFLTDNQVQNFRLLRRRRALLTFDVDYATPVAKLREIPGIVRGIVKSLPLATPEREHLRSFEEPGIRFEVVFHVESPEYVVFMNHLQEFNLRLKSELETLGVAFARPERVVKNANG